MIANRGPEPQLYSVRAAAAILSIGLTTTWKFVSDGTLESVRIGGRRMIRAESLKKLIAHGTSVGQWDAASMIHPGG